MPLERPDWCYKANQFCSCYSGYSVCNLMQDIINKLPRGEVRNEEFRRIAELAEEDPLLVARRCLQVGLD